MSHYFLFLVYYLHTHYFFINMTPRERKYHINKRLRKLLWEEITRVIDEDILNQLNGGEPNPDIETFKTK